MIGTWDIGDEITLEADFEKEDGTPADPAAVTITIRKPDGSAPTTTPLTGNGSGHFEHTLTPDVAGIWRYRIAGVGDPTAAIEDSFRIRTSRVL